MRKNNEESNIKIFRERMETTVKPALNDEEIYEGLIDLFHRALMDAYMKGRKAGIAEWQGLVDEDYYHIDWKKWEAYDDSGRSD